MFVFSLLVESTEVTRRSDDAVDFSKEPERDGMHYSICC
jgi:hypothetical protein